MKEKDRSMQRRYDREGSPWTGLWAVVAKEMADQLTSARMRILEILIVLTAGGTVYMSIQNLQKTVGQDEFLYLNLFTSSTDPMPAFVSFLSFLVPLIAIALMFDAINGEFNRKTMSRVLAQPIYRDALLMGKFIAGFLTMSLVLTAIWLLIYGLGIVGLGVAPNGEEVARSLWFLLATIFYGGIWLTLALVFSVQFRQPATAAMASIAVWLFFMVFWGILAGVISQGLSPIRYGLSEELVKQMQVEMSLSRISPNELYVETMIGLLNPQVRSLGIVMPSQLDGAIMGTALPLNQSLLIIWPQLTAMIAATIILFVVSYALFQRQEIRA